MHFFRSAFLYLSSLLLAGIVLGDLFPWFTSGHSIFLILMLLALLCGIWLRGEFTKWFFFAAFFLLGLNSILFVRSSNNLQGGSVQGFGLVKVEEVRKKEAEWKQLLVRLEQFEESVSDDKILLTTKEDLEVGEVIFLRLDLSKIVNKNNPGEFNAVSYWRGKNVFYAGFLLRDDYKRIKPASGVGLSAFFDGLRSSSERLLKRLVPEGSFGLASAILLGNKGNLSPEVLSDFQSSGAMHVLAVSGLHVGIVMLLLSQFFERISRLINRQKALVLTILITFFYAGLTGFSPSVLRAAIMFSIVMTGQLLSRSSNSLNTLSFWAFVMMLWNPLVIYDMGFQLSYLAMIGILTLYRPIARLFYIRNKILLKIWQGTAVGIAAQITTLPLTLYYFNQFANYFWLSNIAVMAFSGLILGIGLSVLILGRVAFLAKIGGMLLGILISVFISVIDAIADLPFAVAYGFELSLSAMIVIYGLIAFVLFRPVMLRSMLVLCLLTLIPLTFIQVSRYLNISRNEVVVYNASHPCLSFRAGSEVHFFYDEKLKFKQVSRLAKDYIRMHPGRVSYQKLSKAKRFTSSHRFGFELLSEYSFRFRIKERKYQIIRFRGERTSYGRPIYLPYLEGLKGYDLSNGALRIPLSGN